MLSIILNTLLFMIKTTWHHKLWFRVDIWLLTLVKYLAILNLVMLSENDITSLITTASIHNVWYCFVLFLSVPVCFGLYFLVWYCFVSCLALVRLVLSFFFLILSCVLSCVALLHFESFLFCFLWLCFVLHFRQASEFRQTGNSHSKETTRSLKLISS